MSRAWWLLLAATVIASAGAGALVAQGRFRLLAALLLSAAALPLVTHWRVVLYVLLGYLTVAGLVSALLYPWDQARLIPHALAALVYAGLTGEILVRRQSVRLRNPVVVAAGAVAALWLVQTVNPGQLSIDAATLGLVTYVYFMPLAFVGYRALFDTRQVRRFAIFMTATAFPVAAAGIWQFFAGKEAYAALGPGFRSFGVGSGGVDVFRFPATFAFATQLGEYLLFEVLLTAGAIVAFRGPARWVAGAAFTACWVLIAINGSRTLYVVPAVTLSSLAILLSRAHRQPTADRHFQRDRLVNGVSLRTTGTSSAAKWLQLGSVFGLATAGIAFAVWISGPLLAARLSTLDPRQRDNARDLASRVTWTFEQMGTLLESDTPWWLGHGTGTASPYVWHLGVDQPVAEAFFAEVFYQLGALGPMAYVTMFGIVLAEGARSMKPDTRAGDHWIWSRVFFVYTAQVIGTTLLTGAEALVYFPSNALFWLVLGGLLAQGRPHAPAAGGAVATRAAAHPGDNPPANTRGTGRIHGRMAAGRAGS